MFQVKHIVAKLRKGVPSLKRHLLLALKINNKKKVYLDTECAFDPERDRDETDFERLLERRDAFLFGDLL